ncbi:MAG: Zn-dependent protease [Bacteroidia bacterium]|nr:Zn-dependent protease [Sphingobacteriaceae bacterium]MBK7310835.1 Zn-dependent protease [Sphingobacteriaceae bacterium]MBK7817403.1 Zn-dependent protease [Sphingobacteriaceae bacterium]MBP9069487.1 Zn-dependent protease [Bacteroidia bacterium]
MKFLSSIIFFALCISSFTNSPKIYSTKKIIIDLQPFDDLPKEYLNYVHAELKKMYSDIEIKKSIPLPKLAWYSPRKRYRADSLIRYLSRRTPEGHLTIGLTTKDISTTSGDIKDWGIMGLGYCPGKSCVASSFRLSKDKKLLQLFKVSIHELGHTQGIPHCPNKTCYMQDAEGKNKTDEEVGFCDKCKKVLVKAGWALK